MSVTVPDIKRLEQMEDASEMSQLRNSFTSLKDSIIRDGTEMRESMSPLQPILTPHIEVFPSYHQPRTSRHATHRPSLLAASEIRARCQRHRQSGTIPGCDPPALLEAVAGYAEHKPAGSGARGGRVDTLPASPRHSGPPRPGPHREFLLHGPADGRIHRPRGGGSRAF